jgi:archaellum component FlaC
MATTRRDIELLISAKETTGRSFQQVVSNIDALNAKIGEQVAQAERGEISLQELRRTQEALAAAGRDLSAIQGQIDAYNRLVASSAKVAAASEKAQADLAKLKAEIEASGTATTAQENKLQRLENAVTRTSAAVQKSEQDLASQTAALARSGVAVDKLDQSQAGVVNTARQVGAGLAQVNAAVNDYASNVEAARKREADSRRNSADLARLEAAESRAQADADVRAQREAAAQRIALLNQIAEAEKRLAQQSAFDTKISEAQRLGNASQFVRLFADSINTVNAAENQLSALSGFRAIGAQAAEASRDVDRFVASGQGLATSSSAVAEGLRAIINPAAAALQTLDGVEAAIRDASVAAGDGVTNVGLLNGVYNNLEAAIASLLRQGGLVDTFQDQEAATADARRQFELAQAEVQQFGAAMAQADRPTEELARSLQQAEQRLQETGRALGQEEAKLNQLSSELRAAGINTADLAGEQARLGNAATEAATKLESINTTLGRGGRKTDGLFGLKPNDLANLSFQINDIFVSLVSGQNPFIVLIQQGSQISQIFPGLISTIARFAAAFAPVLIVVGAVGAAIFELTTDANRFKQAQDDINASSLGENIDVQRFTDAQEALEGVAESSEQAREAMLLLLDEGFDTDSIERYSEAAANLSERLGIDVVEATQLLVDVQQGGIDAVLDLTEKTNDLTEADLDHAEALFEAGRAGEARQFVLDRVAARNAEIAAATESKWTPAVNNLKSAFSSFAGFLQSVFQPVLDAINNQINNVIIGFTFLTGLLAGKGFDAARAEANAAVRPSAPVTRGASDQVIRDRRFAAELDDEVDTTRELTAQERLRRVEVDARRRAQDAGVSKALEDRAVQQAIAAEQRTINKEQEKGAKSARSSSNRAEAARKRAEREAAAALRKREQALRQLDGQLRQLNRAAFTGESATLEERLRAISERYEDIADSISKVRSLGITTDSDGTDLGAIEKQVAATKQRLKDEETIKFFQERAATLQEQREAEIERVLDAQARNAISTTEAMAQTAEIVGRISPQIADAAQEALKVARALAGTNPSPEMVSWIATLERLASGETINRDVADVGLAGFDATSNELDRLVRERDELVRSYQTLFELGLASEAEVRELTTQAYASQAAAIEPVLVKLREQAALLNATIDPLTQLPVLSDIGYATWLSRLDAVEASLTRIDPRLQQVNAAASQAIQQGVAQSFNAVAQSIVGLIAGTESFGDALGNLGRTALGVFGSILQAIAQVLIQMIALQIAQSLLGIPPGGGGGGGLLSFLFHDGGIVGSRGASRQRRTANSDASWIGAPKFHGGGMAGLRPDEYKTILQRGEEVLTEDNPRHINNVGKGGEGEDGGGTGGLKQVLLLDPSAVPNAMQTRAGQRSMLTVIRQNKETIKQVLK